MHRLLGKHTSVAKGLTNAAVKGLVSTSETLPV